MKRFLAAAVVATVWIVAVLVMAGIAKARRPDHTPPTVSITAPSNGATVSGSVTIAATASDNVGVASVTFEVNAVTIGTDTSAPYSVIWDTTTTSNGSATIVAVAQDIFGNRATSAINVTVNNTSPLAITKNLVTDFGAKCNGVTDDNLAFTAFNTWAQGQTLPITLTIPSGSTCMFISAGMGNWFAKGIKNLLVMGYGATLSDNNGAGNGFFLGGRGVVQDNLHSSRVATVTAGATVVKLLNANESSRFSIGKWALLTGLDMQGYGFPPNPAFFEYVQITAIDTASGTITVSAPLKNAYKSTWPLYWAGNAYEADQGGPATLYALDPSWDTQVEYRGLTISQAGQTYANGRSVTYRDVKFTGAACGVPSQNLIWQAINVDMSTCDMEVDKLIGTMSFTGGTIRQILFQSSSTELFTMDGTTVINTINGTPRKAVISNANLASFNPGALAYGRTEEVVCNNCIIGTFSEFGVADRGGVGFDRLYSMSGGIITSANSNGPLTWAVPGANITWMCYFPHEPPAFQIIDVTQDATNTYVQTSLPAGFPGSPRCGGGNLGIHVHPAPKFTCSNCTGNADVVDLSGAPPAAPLWSYSKRTYTGNTTSTLVPVWGSLSSMTFNVSTAYSGTSALNFNIDAPFIIDSSDNVVTWNPTVNPKLAATRTITPTAVTGAQVGDSISAPGSGAWVPNNQITPKFSTDISTQPPLTWPVVTIEIFTDQGVINPIN